jgi:cellulose synthase operon protein B
MRSLIYKLVQYWHRFFALLAVLVLAPAIGLAQVAPVVDSAPAGSSNSSQNSAPNPQGRVISLSLQQLGAWGSVKLRASQPSRLLGFGIRADEQVVSAKLVLAYDYSPALHEELSSLNVYVNDQMLTVERLVHAKSAGVRREFGINPAIFKAYNELRFDFLGVYQLSCQNPLQSSFWLTLNDPTRLELTVVPKQVAPDLRTLPAPFIDKADLEPKVGFVFASSPSQASLKAAGVLASWFGIQGGARSPKFQTSINEIPKGNNILFLSGKEEVAGIRADSQAGAALITNPVDSDSVLLVLSGGSDGKIVNVAQTIALFNKTLSGPKFKLGPDFKLAEREPYDAPAWVRTDRPMKLGELAKLEELKTKGFFPEVIRVNFRTPPDVFTWRSPGVPLHLKYRATRFSHLRTSALGIGVNNTFIDSVALNDYAKPIDNDKPALKKVSEAIVTNNKSLSEIATFLPPYAVTGRDQLQFSFSNDISSGNPCDLPTDNFVAAIDAESTIDFSQFPKFVALPNLAYFVQTGFPFTRLADLSETAVVISNKPTAHEIKVYLNILSKLGEASGFPATKHELVFYSEVSTSGEKDLIVIGAGPNQSLLSAWASAIPLVTENGVRTVKEPTVSWRPAFRWEQQDIDPNLKLSNQVTLTSFGDLVTVMGFESPLKATRSVVYIYADKASDLEQFTDLLGDPSKTSLIAGDFVVVGNKSATPAKVSKTYFLGSIPFSSQVRWILTDHPILVAIASLIFLLMLAIVLYKPLMGLAKSMRKVD